MKDFYLTLLSDSSIDTFPNNKQCRFTVRLDHPIHIDKENWEVSLVEMITPSEILNISDKNNYFYVKCYNKNMCETMGVENLKEKCDRREGCTEFELRIPEGNYSSPQHLADEIESQLKKRFGQILGKYNATIQVNYVKNAQRIKIHYQDAKVAKLAFPQPLGEKLGLDPVYFDRAIGYQKHIFKYGVDLNTVCNQMYVYSDIASYTFVGHVTAPILRVVSFQPSKENSHTHWEFLNLHYVPVSKSFIDQVHVSIKGDTGENIPFITGKTLIKLHFRLRKD